MSGARLGTFASSQTRGAHSPADLRCPACREPRRLHNAGGNVRADSECTNPFGGANVPTSAPAEPASAGPGDDDAAAGGAREADAPAESVETPRRTDPRPAVERALVPAAVVGGDDADEEVAAEPFTAATALDQPGAFVEHLVATAYYVSPRWSCPSCISWPASPGACAVCGTPLQPVYLATVPREVTQ